jgi:hypothetical protein
MHNQYLHNHQNINDPKRFRYAGPRWLARCITRLIPKPDLVIVLDAPAEVLQSRKQEVPLTETARQREAYCAVARDMPGGRIIDATQPIECVTADVKDAIVEFIAARTSRRFQGVGGLFRGRLGEPGVRDEYSSDLEVVRDEYSSDLEKDIRPFSTSHMEVG